MGINDLEPWEETLRILSDPELMKQVRVARTELDQPVVLTKEEAIALSVSIN